MAIMSVFLSGAVAHSGQRFELVQLQSSLQPDALLDLPLSTIPHPQLPAGYSLREFLIHFESLQYTLTWEEGLPGTYLLRVTGMNRLTRQSFDAAFSFIPVDENGQRTSDDRAQLVQLAQASFNGEMVEAAGIYQLVWSTVANGVMARRQAGAN